MFNEMVDSLSLGIKKTLHVYSEFLSLNNTDITALVNLILLHSDFYTTKKFNKMTTNTNQNQNQTQNSLIRV